MLTTKTPEQCYCVVQVFRLLPLNRFHMFKVSIVKVEHVNEVVL